MSEDAGKRKSVQDFLQNVKSGVGLFEWIEREVKHPDTTAGCSKARSLSGRQIANITELLEDDLKHCFDEGYFAFRFVSAIQGSGKTALLTHFKDLMDTKYENSIVVSFPLSDISSIGGRLDFGIKLYCHILSQTFLKLLNHQKPSVKDVAEGILKSCSSDQASISQLLTSRTNQIAFCDTFFDFLSKSNIAFEKLFFKVINEITKTNSNIAFAYLIDELDSLSERRSDFTDVRSFIKALINTVSNNFKQKIRLLVYLAGTLTNMETFISDDKALQSRVEHNVLNLHSGNDNELKMIRSKIDERIHGEFGGYQNFKKAWEDIERIQFKTAMTLREFCEYYGHKMLEIYEENFKEASEIVFEGNARDLLEARCYEEWNEYLNKTQTYSLSSNKTTTIIKGHAFDCYAELIHNDHCVAKCYGEAKNYELKKEHLDVFSEWLKDVHFNPDSTYPDLAYMIAPSCPDLLLRKLENKNIGFIESPKVVDKKQPKDESTSKPDTIDDKKQSNSEKEQTKKKPKSKKPTISELRALAKEKGIKIPSKIKRQADIIEFLNNKSAFEDDPNSHLNIKGTIF